MPKVTFHCDGCGKQEDGAWANGQAFKPEHWFQRSDEDGTQLACSRDCIAEVAKKTGKTRIVSPI